VRKALRVGKNIEHFKAAAVALQSPVTKVFISHGFLADCQVSYVPANASEDVLRYLAVGRQLGYAGYLSLDILTYVRLLFIALD
jgi:peroxin-11B